MATESGTRTFDLSLVTPEGAAFEGEAEMLIVPGDAGEIGVLARHAPLVAMLKAGETRVKSGGEWSFFATGPGFFKVQQDRALVLVDDAVRAKDIDVGAGGVSRRAKPGSAAALTPLAAGAFGGPCCFRTVPPRLSCQRRPRRQSAEPGRAASPAGRSPAPPPPAS